MGRIQPDSATVECRRPAQESLAGLVRNAGWLTGGRLITDLTSLLLFIVISRNYGIAGIGQYAYGFAVAGLAASFMSLGIEDYAIRELSRLSSSNDKLHLMRTLFGTQVYAVLLSCLLLPPYLILTDATHEVVMIITVLCIYTFCLTTSRTLLAPAISNQAMKGPSIAELLCNAPPAIFSIALMQSLHVDMAIALIPVSLGMMFLLAYGFVSARRHLGVVYPVASMRDAISIISRTWPFAASVVVFYLSSRLSLVIVSLLGGDTVAGLFATGLKILDVGSRPLNFIGVASYPTLSRCFDYDKPGFTHAAERLLKLSFLAGFALTFAMIFIVPAILPLVFGEEFIPAIPVVQATAVIAIFVAIDLTAYRLLFAMHLQNRRVMIHVAGVLLAAVASIGLIPTIGVYGAILATFLSYAFMSFMYGRIIAGGSSTRILLVSFRNYGAAMLASSAGGATVYWSMQRLDAAAAAVLILFSITMIALRRVTPTKVGHEPS